jgi:cell division protein FtsB
VTVPERRADGAGSSGAGSRAAGNGGAGTRGAAARGAAARGAGARPHFTGRAAVLAIVLCAIALSLAYPVREYISQRRQIDQLLAQGAQIRQQHKRLETQRRLLHSPGYIEQQARDRLHMCLPSQVCYEIIGRSRRPKRAPARAAADPWYARVWSSVQQADVSQAAGRSAARPASAGKRAARAHR